MKFNKINQLVGEAFMVTCKIGTRYANPVLRIVTGCDPISMTMLDRKTSRDWSINLTLFKVRFLKSGVIVFSGPGHRIALFPVPVELIQDGHKLTGTPQGVPILTLGSR